MTLGKTVSAATTLLACLWGTGPLAADTITINPVLDNTLVESPDGSLSNGIGDYLFVGRTGQPPGQSIRRGLLKFDLGAAVPADATINSATLTLRMSRSNQAQTETIYLHRVLASWGEGTSNGAGQEGGGAPATTGDATWLHRFFNTTSWVSPGGDFVATATASTPIGDTNGFYSWSSAQLRTDVQSWLSNASSNAGWVLIGNESADYTAKRFDSRHVTDVSRRPKLLIDYTPLAAWGADASGNWSTGSNWTSGVAPSGVDARAKLGPVITAPRTVTIDVPVTLGQLTLDSTSRYTLAGVQPITLDVATGSAAVNLVSGSHTISAPMVLADDTTLAVAPSASVVTLSGSISAPGRSISKTGAGRADVSNLDVGAIDVQFGTLRLLSGSGTSRTDGSAIAGGANPAAKLDIADNALVVQNAAGQHATVAAQVRSAFAAGAWTGNGITSSQADAGNVCVGYAPASALATIPPVFGAAGPNAMLIRLTRYGDANLSGAVDLDDFNLLASAFGTQGNYWSSGNFSYDPAGVVDLDDFNLLATNFGLTATGEVTPQDWAALAAAVPEPGLGGFAALGLLALRRIARR